jgi:transcriptional regulator with XRE-family HTH domain
MLSSQNKRRKFESSAAQFLYDRYAGNDPDLIEAYEQEVLNAGIARTIFNVRTKAGLSQRELAERVGTSASAICRLEDADYEGHSLSLLKRIAAALDKRVEVRLVSAKKHGGLKARKTIPRARPASTVTAADGNQRAGRD